MEPTNFAAWVAQQKVLEASDIIAVDDLIAIGKKVNKRRDGEQYQEFAMPISEFLMLAGGAVSSVFGRVGNVVAQAGDYNTTLVTEGINLYFTDARAIAAPITGFVSGAGSILPTDTILEAIQKLDGNLTASVSGTANYVAKFTSATAVGDSQIFDNGTGVAIGTNSPIANTLLTLKGATSAAADFVSKMVDSSDNLLFAVENNGLVTGGNSSYTFSFGSISSLIDSDILDVGSVTRGANTFLRINGGAYPGLIFNNTFYGDKMYMYSGFGGNHLEITRVAGSGIFTYIAENAVGVGLKSIHPTPTAALDVLGIDATSSHHALKVHNSAIVELFSVRNDGAIFLNGNSYFASGIYMENNQFLYAKTPSSVYREVLMGSSAIDDITSLTYGAGGFILRDKDGISSMWVRDDNVFGFGFSFAETTHMNSKYNFKVSSIDGDGIRLHNPQAADGVGGAVFSSMGSSGYGVSGWANSTLIEHSSTGSLVLSAYLTDIKFQTGARVTQMTLKSTGVLNMTTQTYADNAAATGGGLVFGDVYKTATGELRIVV